MNIAEFGSASTTTTCGVQMYNMAWQSQTGSTTDGIIIRRSNHCRFVNCGFSFFESGTAIDFHSDGDGCIIPKFEGCTFRRNLKHIDDDTSGGGTNTSLQIFGGYFDGGLLSGGVGLTYSETMMVFGAAFDSHITAIDLTGDGSSVIGCRFELNTTAVSMSSQDRQRVIGNFFGHDFGTTPSTVAVDVTATAGNDLTVTGNSYQGYVTNNQISGSYAVTNQIIIDDPISYEKRVRTSGSNNTFTLANNFQSFGNDTEIVATANAGNIGTFFRCHFDTTASDSGLEIGTSTVHDVMIHVNDVESARFDDNGTAGNTRFLIYDVDNGQVERVSVGAADSGGAGFKVLRIPN